MVWQLFGAIDSSLLELHVELMHATSCLCRTEHSWRQVEKLILSLLSEVYKIWPFRLDLVRWLSEATTLIATLMQALISGLVGALSLLLPLLSFPCHRRAFQLSSLFFLMLSRKLALMHACALHILITTTIVTPLVIFCLFLLDHAEFRVLNSGDQIRLSNCSRLLLLLHHRLSWRDKC